MGSIVLGSDFEASVISIKSGFPVDCRIWLMKHGKSNPIIIGDYNITHDMASIEISIPPFKFDPKNKLQFYQEVKKGIKVLEEFVESRNPNYRVVFNDCGKMSYEISMTKSEELSIYKGKDSGRSIMSRYTPNGLHIHVSGVPGVKSLIRRLDMTIGLLYKIISIGSRRKLYGKLGVYKLKQYDIVTDGFEYRTLGSKMLRPMNLKIVSILLNRSLKNYVK